MGTSMRSIVFKDRMGLDRMSEVASESSIAAEKYVQDATNAIERQIANAETVLGNLRKNAEKVEARMRQLEEEISFTKSEQIREEKLAQLDSLRETLLELGKDIEAVEQNISCTKTLFTEWKKMGEICIDNIRKRLNEAEVTSSRIIETVAERP